ncbi:30S ribosomal protein S15 [Mycoplasmopsis agalactiae]|uniref:30S ribosomal protein S15 n=1 Tax=Mycoplasmopsis agalactiae TaxID=2110 RepID=UPI001455F8C2|nr:30S ribosomal protein S15 [Mycoplasmopsis agalactiae]MCE6057010.1 30S ribosomal protein S15 [Mycoplasmopsis agalactiae]MCE6078797.1 30S ribosomal protein S15 [Mycoplasmopsis agalactiae]MCE6095180.1 30S ribosomal protein S15 [Mycoplasmopsis agalactiae]MCE6114435.1 30S ribosomal protein S15 [Mycoplasmopsis agalactiae]NLS34270.1 30S ribosomal protein S15 [Mycoplasmopsis agalactiae]
MITKEQKAQIVTKYGANKKDTGNIFVQIAILTAEIEDLKPHFLANPKDNHSRRGFIAKITKRRILLQHLKKENFELYNKVLAELNLRK